MTLQHQLCCLNDIVNLVEELAVFALKADIKLNYTFQNQETLYVSGNEEQLYRLISNLIDNAIQYTPTEGEVTVLLFSSERFAQIQISDTGIGISPKDRDRILIDFIELMVIDPALRRIRIGACDRSGDCSSPSRSDRGSKSIG
jgi:signal transduction histidine kinase